MLGGFRIGSVAVPPETLGWTRAPELDRVKASGEKALAYRDRNGAPYLFAWGQTPALRVPTIGEYGKRQ